MEIIIDYIKYDVTGATAEVSGYDRRKKYIHTIRIPRYIDVKGKKVEVVGGKDGFMGGLNGCVLEVPNTWHIHGVSLLDHAGESDIVDGVTCRIYEAREGYKEQHPKAVKSDRAVKTDKVVPVLIQCLIWMIAMTLMVLSVKYWKWWTLLSFIPILGSTTLTSLSISNEEIGKSGFNIKPALIKVLVWLVCLTAFYLSITYLHWWTFVTVIPIMILFFKIIMDD